MCMKEIRIQTRTNGDEVMIEKTLGNGYVSFREIMRMRIFEAGVFWITHRFMVQVLIGRSHIARQVQGHTFRMTEHTKTTNVANGRLREQVASLR